MLIRWPLFLSVCLRRKLAFWRLAIQTKKSTTDLPKTLPTAGEEANVQMTDQLSLLKTRSRAGADAGAQNLTVTFSNNKKPSHGGTKMGCDIPVPHIFAQVWGFIYANPARVAGFR